MSKLKKISISLVLLLALTINTYATYDHLLGIGSATEASQQSLWCWAACARMMGNAYNNGTVPTQSEICYEVKGSIINQRAANIGEVEDAVYFACDMWSWKFTTRTPFTDFDTMEEVLDDYEPFTYTTSWHQKYCNGYNTLGGNEWLRVVDPDTGDWEYVDHYDEFYGNAVKKTIFRKNSAL